MTPAASPPSNSPTTTAEQVQKLRRFRSGFHRCWTGWADAGFEVCDAVLCAPGSVSSTPALSLEPCFRRSHGSLYKALARGRVDPEQIRHLLVAFRPTDWPEVFAVDASTWPRCDAECSPGRGFYYSASKHSAGQPIVAGWSYQWVTQLDWANDSWTAPIDAVRLQPGQGATTATIAQIREVTARLAASRPAGKTPTFVFDAGYDPIALTYELDEVPANLVVRIRDDRAFYADPGDRQPGTLGRSRRHGRRFKCDDPTTWPAPDQQITSTDIRYGTVTVQAWHDLHPQLAGRGHWADFGQPPIVPGTVVRVDVEHLPKHTSRAKKSLWLWVAGPDPDLDVCWRAYLRRFDIEHGFRFAKNTLGWTTPRMCTPEQADTWTWIIIAACTQLRLA